jgi:formylglycine-generating enzyme required for sulfatase activity
MDSKTLEIIIPSSGKRILIFSKDLDTKLGWFEAKEACGKLGYGWRLPTKEELEIIYKNLHKKARGDFKLSFYWSGTEVDKYISAWGYNFIFGYADEKKMLFKARVRPVKTIKYNIN